MGSAAVLSQQRLFMLKKGTGGPVCEAYVDVLNRTDFKYRPLFYALRDDNPSHRFQMPERHYLTVADLALFDNVYEFMSFGDHDLVTQCFHPNPDPRKPFRNPAQLPGAKSATRSDVDSRFASSVWTRSAHHSRFVLKPDRTAAAPRARRRSRQSCTAEEAAGA
jgi:hypothetical protein